MKISSSLRLSSACFVILCAILFGCQKRAATVVIDVNQYVHHPNLEATYKGFQDVVDAWGKTKGIQIEYRLQIANGDASVATQIARQDVAENPNLILALATPSAQASVKATSTIPIVFGAITDPVAAGLVKSLTKPGGNTTGSSDVWPYEKQFELIRKLRPDARTIGIVLNPGEANTVASMKLIEPALQHYGFRKVEASVANTSEVLAAAQSLVGRCDVFYAPADNTVLSGLDAFVKVAQKSKTPLFVGDEGSVSKGGVATYGIDYYKLGRATGESAVKILEGTPPGQIPVASGLGAKLVVNVSAAEKQGLVFPESLLKDATVVGSR
jgi:putative ABC transport system substrate-binding protein